MEESYEPSKVPQCLDDRDIPSLCYITDVWIPGWQFFPCEEVLSVWADVRRHVCSNYKGNENDYYNSKQNLCWECPFLGDITLLYSTSAWRRWSASGFVPYFIPTTNTSIFPTFVMVFINSRYICARELVSYIALVANFLRMKENYFS